MNKRIIFTDRSDELLDQYLKDIAKYKILNDDEINSLIQKYHKGDKSVIDTICKSNLRFVVSIAKTFQNRGIPLLDLINEGNCGLLKAISKYDPNKGTTFLSYASWWIQQSIYNTIYKNAKEIRLPMSQQLLVITLLDATNKFLQEKHRSPSTKELSEITNIPEDKIEYLHQFSNKVISVDDFISGDEENSQVCDIIPDLSPNIDDTLNVQYVNEELEKILDKLTIREHDILKLLFGIGVGSVSSKRVSEMFGVTKERIRQMKEDALKKLKRKFGNKLKDLL